MSKRKMSLLSSFENISPQVISRVGREIQDLQRNPPDGIRFLPQEEDTIAEIHAEIKGPAGTPYDGGSFHIKLVLGNDFPHSPPRGFFLTKIYHPNVAANGDICVNTLKRDWTAEVTLTHVLQVIRCLLIVPFPESSLNDEAGRLFMESYSEYERRVKVWVSVHASKSLSGDGAGDTGDCGSSNNSNTINKTSGNGGGGEKKRGGVKAGAKVKGAVASSSVAANSQPALAVKSAGEEGGEVGGSVAAAAAVEKGADTAGGNGGGDPASKRRQEAPRKTAKDRQKEAKKRGLKRL